MHIGNLGHGIFKLGTISSSSVAGELLLDLTEE